MPTASFAGEAGWSGRATISKFYALNENQVIIKLSDFKNPGKCNVTESGDVIVSPNTEKTWFTILLSAFMSGKEVNIYVSNNCTPYWSGTDFAKIGHVVVFQ
ncbi:hypothetical protein A3759_17525 [Thalassolituus sp. HI0120]|nr:hypothetical protein A3759_17525 [Thalassolituus sp. HI0120]